MPWDEIDADAAGFYRRVLQTLNVAGLRFLVGGAFAFTCFTGIHRNTKDLDLFIAREDYDAVAQAPARRGLRHRAHLPSLARKSAQR